MTNLPSQPTMAKPFAASGDKNSVTAASDSSKMNLTDGFPVIFSTLIKDGGKFIDRKDINGILNLLSSVGYYALCGGQMMWSSAMKTALGGYPLYARLWYNLGSQLVMVESQSANNMVEPTGSTIDKSFTYEGTTKVWWKRVTDTDATGHADEDLALAGGTMSGTINFSTPYALQRSTDDGNLNLYGGADRDGGGSFQMFGKSSSDSAGYFQLRASTSTSDKKFLVGRPDGRLYWNGSEIVRKVNNKSAATDGSGNVTLAASDVGALPTTGGTMTGPIYTSSSDGIARSGTSGALKLDGDSNSTGAMLALYGKDNASYPGNFDLRAQTSTSNGKHLIGKTDGTLTWNTRNVARSVNSVYANAAGNITLALMPDYSSATTVSVPYTASANGYMIFTRGDTAKEVAYAIDDVQVWSSGVWDARCGTGMCPIAKGDVVTQVSSTSGTVKFVPLK